MYKIQFIGNQNTEFTSQWKKKGVDSLLKDTGDYVADFISKNGKTPNNLPNTPILLKRGGEPLIVETAKRRAAFLRKKYNIDNTPIIQEPINSRLEKYKANKKRNSSIIKYSPPKSTTKPKVTKLLTKNKLAMGAVGLATAGVIGYGLIRKMRSDKGKKRGFYK